ncbi:high-affinity branched-chain amino acid ABC transporter permease LivM [Methylocapsa acidiphila]|uniref:high-affinity branched-chain amino acid ABC transporter permease LivM n=1 Tax=Methylocapsa acidiphila TaxID=133552 RepID=UPI0009FCD398|nr:high-affinity branched-chain amino acid ABC transporter permease LivM [Methylocapsa acidiphila]
MSKRCEPPATFAPAPEASPLRDRLRSALIGAAKAAGVALGLAFPLLAYRTETDFSNALVLQERWAAVAAIALAAFVVRLICLLIPGRTKAASSPRRRRAEFAAIVARSRRLISAAGLASLIAFPLVVLVLLGPARSLKWIDSYGIQILIYMTLGWGLNIVVGLAGLLDLGYVAFYAVGAYSYALLSTNFGWSFWASLPIAGLLAALWGVALGFPVLRLRGDYLAIVTLAFGEIIRIVLTNWTDLTNGEAGVSSIPRVSFFGLPFIAGPEGFAAHFGLAYSPIYRVIFLFYLALALALLTNFVTLRLRRMPLGRAWEALREDEIACRSLGINTVAVKLAAFALGALVGGLAGAVFAARQGFVSPSSFTFIESATILAIVVLGGAGSQLGVALAALFIIGGSELLRELDWLQHIVGEGFDPTQYRMLIIGFALIVIMNWKPRGLIANRTPSVFLAEPRLAAPALAEEGRV